MRQSGKTYHIVNLKTKTALNSDPDDCDISIAGITGEDRPKWTLEQMGPGGPWTIENAPRRNYLAPPRTDLNQRPLRSLVTPYHWFIEVEGDGYRIQPTEFANFNLDGKDESEYGNLNIPVNLQSKKTGLEHLWEFKEVQFDRDD